VEASFSAPVQTCAHPASYSRGTASFPGVKRPVRGVDDLPPSSAKVKERVHLYIYSFSGPSLSILGCTLRLLWKIFEKNCWGEYLCVSGRKWQEDGKTLYNKKPRYLWSSPYILKKMKNRKLRRIGCVAHVNESLKGSDYFRDTVIYGRIILKRILKY
jgi:hypothetical protein